MHRRARSWQPTPPPGSNWQVRFGQLKSWRTSWRLQTDHNTMDERLLNPISTRELERRWAAARKAMAERKIDALLMQNSNDFVGGYVRWFTDTPVTDGYIPRLRPDDHGRHGRKGRASQARRP